MKEQKRAIKVHERAHLGRVCGLQERHAVHELDPLRLRSDQIGALGRRYIEIRWGLDEGNIRIKYVSGRGVRKALHRKQIGVR